MNAVIYARYSSDNQREESIEGQIRECTAYAERNGITVVRHYIDRALSAKTDNRPDFQQMIRDSNKKLFEIVLVWKFDRFARNRFDSANYKMILKKNNVHLISVMEPIAEGSQGILVETLLEGMAEYYSAELSEKVIRGQTENALKGKCTGGTGTIGYKIDADKFYRIDPLISPLVLEAFQRYDNGEKIVEIMNYLNEKGVRNMLGGKLTCSSMNTMLKNRRYIGELSFRDTVVPDAIPAIVPKDLFDRVQKRMEKNKRAPARGKADEEYLLTTKLFCGKCGALMFGESGTSATGRTYYYYKCATAKKKKGCNKKTVQKEWLENLVVQETMKLIQDDAVIERIVQLVMDFQNQENTAIPLLEKQLREVDRKLDNLMKAIEEGLFTRTTKERLDALEAQKDELTAKIADEKLRKPSFNADFIRFWLMKFRKFDVSQQKQRKALIEIFVNAIFLYDDRMLITFNYKDGSQTVRFEDTLAADELAGNSSDLSSSARSGATVGKSFIYHNYYGRAAYAGYLIKASFNRLVLPEFVYYYTCSSAYEIWKNSIFIQSTIQNIGADRYSNLPISVPNSIDKQLRIVRYLNNFCSKFDAIIYNLQTSIEDYKKLKQAVITQAITKGVRGEREMKDSGVAWIGEIPKEWDIIKSSRIIKTTQNGLSRRDLEKSEGQIILKLKNITSDGKIDYSFLNRITLSQNELNTYALTTGDFLFVRVNGSKSLVGKCAIFEAISEIVAYNDHIIRVKLSNQCYNRFFLWYLYSCCGKAEIDLHTSTAAGQYTISGDGLRDITLVFPPIDEQKEIADYLDAKCAEIDRLIAKKEQLVKELESYKKSLIYEVVTGKREV